MAETRTRIDLSAMPNADTPLGTYEGRCNPEYVMAFVGENSDRVTIYLSPSQARAWAHAILADAERADPIKVAA